MKFNVVEKDKIKGARKKYTVVTSLVSAAALTIIILSGAYLYISTWTPVEAFTVKKAGSTRILVELETKVPVEGRLFYGTSPLYLNERSIEGSIEGAQKLTIEHVLPGKEHYVRFVAKTQDGREFDTGFIVAK